LPDPIIVLTPRRHGSTLFLNSLEQSLGIVNLGEIAPLIHHLWIGSGTSNHSDFSLDQCWMPAEVRLENMCRFTARTVASMKEPSQVATFKYNPGGPLVNRQLSPLSSSLPLRRDVPQIHADLLRQTWPQALFVCLIRDPIDAALSSQVKYQLGGLHDWRRFWWRYGMAHGLMAELADSARTIIVTFDQLVLGDSAALSGVRTFLQPYGSWDVALARQWWAAPAGDRSQEFASMHNFRRLGRLPLTAKISVPRWAVDYVHTVWARSGAPDPPRWE
jgi:hypothetical protein